MCFRKYKILAVFVSMVFLSSCFKTGLNVSPAEGHKISKARKVIVTLDDGTEVELKKVRIENEKMIGETPSKEQKEIDLTSITMVKIEKTNYAYAVLSGCVGLVALWLINGMATAPSPPPPESCPFIHSYDGEKYVLDAEPYGAAVCRGLKRTEWCALEHLKENEGRYKILITNELEETQFVDELNLLVVDHSPEVTVVPDPFGRLHTVGQTFLPQLAYEKDGKDIKPYVDKKDGVFWKSRVKEKSCWEEKNFRDELILVFPKPETSKKAKLVVNAYTTFWGSYNVKRFLGLHGNKIDQWYKEVDQYGPAYYSVTNMAVREELYYLKVNVETEDGWKSRGLIYGGGPFVADDKAYSIDISDVPGDCLKIKLFPPVNFWMIDFIAVDYSENVPVQITELEPHEARTNQGKDVSEYLTENDDMYFIMPRIGDAAELIFEPPCCPGHLRRSVLLKASGYYDIHLEAGGEPQKEALRRFLFEPGFAVRNAYQEYLMWTKHTFKTKQSKR